MMGVNVDGPIGAGVDAGGPAVTVTVDREGTAGNAGKVGAPDRDSVAQDVKTRTALTVIAQKRSRMGTSNHARTASRVGVGRAVVGPIAFLAPSGLGVDTTPLGSGVGVDLALPAE